jgi:hypothetical protein
VHFATILVEALKASPRISFSLTPGRAVLTSASNIASPMVQVLRRHSTSSGSLFLRAASMATNPSPLHFTPFASNAAVMNGSAKSIASTSFSTPARFSSGMIWSTKRATAALWAPSPMQRAIQPMPVMA